MCNTSMLQTLTRPKYSKWLEMHSDVVTFQQELTNLLMYEFVIPLLNQWSFIIRLCMVLASEWPLGHNLLRSSWFYFRDSRVTWPFTLFFFLNIYSLSQCFTCCLCLAFYVDQDWLSPKDIWQLGPEPSISPKSDHSLFLFPLWTIRLSRSQNPFHSNC